MDNERHHVFASFNLGCNVSVDDPAAGYVHDDVVGVDVVPARAVHQHHAGTVVRRDVLVPTNRIVVLKCHMQDVQ